MTKRMLIDATHAEETRVVVLDGNRLEDFDVETSTKRQLKGNIYLAKVVRVEPSLQAAFVEYGGNRHGFLAFDEIHPDYYQIPVADRERLLAMQAEQVRREEEAEAEREEQGAEPAGDQGPAEAGDPRDRFPVREEPDSDSTTPPGIESVYRSGPESVEHQVEQPPAELATIAETGDESGATAELLTGSPDNGDASEGEREGAAGIEADAPSGFAPDAGRGDADHSPDGDADPDADADSGFDRIPELPPPETVGGDHDTVEEARERRIPPRFLRNYKIQEVIRRRQILLVQVVKEERGTKGAALTTYISLAGRYCVLMPNSPRGGGISRKITSAADRRRLKEVTAELDLPDGMGLIVRTAGANRPKPEIKRDCEYLLRLWDDIREHTMRSVAPALIYEEASLIKRAIRDVYSRDIDEITVDGEAGWRAARDFMRMLMPSHVKKVQLWRDPSASAASAVASPVGGQPLFSRHQVDAQLDAVLSPTVQLRSGGYLVINQAEALVAIDVNSGRSTRERGIEETALRTNLEAADEVARQLRLRDLAGLIVIDFIDMESKKHNAMVERRLKDALKTDRARIQVGHISHFGLLEMSRQRLRPSLAETSFVLCAHCGGTGHVRSTESAAIHVLRGIEEEAAKHRAAEVLVHAATSIEMYIFNHKRDRLAEIETRYGMRVAFAADDALISPQFRIERLRVQTTPEAPVAITAGPGHALPPLAEPEEPADDAPAVVTDDAVEPIAPANDEEAGQPPIEAGAEASAAESAEEAERHRRRRRRRRRGGRRDDAPAAGEAPGDAPAMPTDQDMPEAHLEGVPEHADPAASDDEGARRRGRRGRRRRRDGETLPEIAAPGAEQPELLHTGPTPANPFGSHGFDIFDVLEQVEQRSAGPPPSVLPVIARPPTAEPVPAESVPAESVPAESVPAGAAADIEPEPAGFDDAPLESSPASAIPIAPPAADALPDLQPEPPDAPIAPEPAPNAPTVAEPEPPAPANDREPEPAVRPIVIGVEDEPAAEKKRGWWRR